VIDDMRIAGCAGCPPVLRIMAGGCKMGEGGNGWFVGICRYATMFSVVRKNEYCKDIT
jgi:hypothetical protein